VVVGMSVALGAFGVLVLSLLLLALIISSKGYPLSPVSMSSSLLARSPQFGSRLHYYLFHFYK